MFREADKDPATSLNFEEFCRIMAPRFEQRDGGDEIMKTFELFDEDKKGKIDFKNLKKIAHEVGEDLSDKELHEMIAEADRTGDGMISF